MTAKEVAFRLGLKESAVTKNFNRTQENLRNKGILLMKWGRGKDAEFDLEYLDYLIEEDE